MNQMNMAGYQPGNPALGNMPMPNNGPNGAMRIPDENVDEASYEARLNANIYGYLCHKGQFDSARALKNSGMPFEPPLIDGDADGQDDNDSKENVNKNLPDDLPNPKLQTDGQGGPFLLSWFALFWDFFLVQRKDSRGSKNAMNFVNHTQSQARLRQEQQQRMFQGAPMINNRMTEYQMNQMMAMQGGMAGDNLRQRALQNNRMQPTPQQMQAMRTLNMPNRRDPAMDMNGQRPRTPSGGDHAPSPSKRQRMEGVPFDGPQMMPNGRGPQGMPPGMMGGDVAALNANHLLMNSGINPGNLSDSQFASFQQQNPAVQQKSIQVYAQNLAKNQRQQSMSHAGGISDQGSPFMDSGMGDMGPDFYGGAGNPAAMQMRGGPQPNMPNGAGGGNHALQDYQMQLMLLEQQNKKRLLMARQEHDTIGGRPDGQPGMPGAAGYIPGMSPGSRGGPSPDPSNNKRGTPKMNQVGLPGGGSPMPDGSMRGSPAAMGFGMNPDLYAQMNANGMRPPPSSNPGFANQQFSQQQQLEAMARQNAGRGIGNGWQPQGQQQMMGQPQPQQPAPIGTPQTRNTDMPPPQAVPNATTNGRPASPGAAPPTPQTANKAAPKGKKEPTRKKPSKKPTNPTPAPEPDTQPPGTPTPATPSTPRHADSISGPKIEGQGPGQPNIMQPMPPNGNVDQIPPPPPDPTGLNYGSLEGAEDPYSLAYNNDLNNSDILENFDFEQFLQNTQDADFSFDPAAFDGADGIEAGMTGT